MTNKNLQIILEILVRLDKLKVRIDENKKLWTITAERVEGIEHE